MVLSVSLRVNVLSEAALEEAFLMKKPDEEMGRGRGVVSRPHFACELERDGLSEEGRNHAVLVTW